MQNHRMAITVKKIMSERLTHLMRVTPDLDTLQKVADRSGVSYGTVRRIKVADDVDVSISNAEEVARTFGLTLIEFISNPGEGFKLSPDEFTLLQQFKQMDAKDRTEVLFYVSSKAAITKMMQSQS